MQKIVLMGVAGCGKTSVGEALQARLGIPYRDGDDMHPPANIEKMRQGIPLSDSDRWPWLDRVAADLVATAPVIIGCSSLKRAYRGRIRAGAHGPVFFVHLHGSRDLIAARMGQRKGHYMPLSLLDSQFAALEPPGPEEALLVDINQPIAAIVAQIADAVQRAEL